MQASQVPAKFPIPFAYAAGSGYKRTVPQASQIGITAGAASLTDGFPPVCFQPVGAGGTPPSGQDFNGLLNQVTLWNQWESAGAPVYYDSTFSAAIGGYPQGAILSSVATTGNFWLSTVDNNTSNPDAGGANWTSFSAATATSLVHFGTDSGSVNSYTLTSVTPTISAYADGMVVIMHVPSNTNTGASTVQIGTLSRVSITRADGTATQKGDLPAGGYVQMIYDAGTTSFLISGLFSANSPPRNLVSYTTAGTYTFTVPSGIVWILVQLVGAGGGGACGGGSFSNLSGGGGGSGGYSESWVAVTPGQTITVTVGAGGVGSTTNGVAATSGGTTSFGAFLQATGGGGAILTTGSTAAGGAYGVGSGGQINFNGANGGDGNYAVAQIQGGAGAPSAFGGGGRTSTVGLPSRPDLVNGVAPGSGGGGIWGTGVSNLQGGDGAAGAVLIQY